MSNIFIDIVSKLIQMTQERQLHWERSEAPSHLSDSERKIESIYTTDFKGKRLRIYEERHRDYSVDFDKVVWANRPVLQIIDDDGNEMWEFPSTTGNWDLLEAVKYQTAGVSDFIASLLRTEPSSLVK